MKIKDLPKKLRTARLSVSEAIRYSLETIEISKKLSKIYDTYIQKVLASINDQKIINDEIVISLSVHELAQINEALCDYITMRVANIVDPHPASKSLKDFPTINLKKIREIAEVKTILNACDNWIRHINKRFIGPVDKNVLHSDKLTGLLKFLQMLICTEIVKEQSKELLEEAKQKVEEMIEK